MNIIGVSGIEQAMPFKRRHWPSLEEREYRMSQGHDAAAALVVDGTCVAAAAEERFDRRKHSSAFPSGSLRYCLEHAGLNLSDVDEIAHSFDYSPYDRFYSADPYTASMFDEVFSKEAFARVVKRDFPDFPQSRIQYVPHHLAHAASAYYTSGWDSCLVVVMDGMGEAHSASVYSGVAGQLKTLKQVSATDSIGVLYSLVTFHLGFDFNSDEYKIMGLAPYGDPARHREFFRRAVLLTEDGSIRIPLLRMNRSREDREVYSGSRQYLAKHLCPRREPDSEITADHCDVAAALQEMLDVVVLHMCGSYSRSTGLRRLAMAGGVALNCTANGRLLESGLFEGVYVQPAAGDDGSALGAALYRAARRGEIRNCRFPVPALGPEYSDNDVATALRSFADRLDVVRYSDLQQTCDETARLIQAGQVVAWFRGRMEYGPRALGQRSILADPGDPGMRDRLNAMVKLRESFRPFAPAVTLEQVHLWFDVPPGTQLPYMIFTVNVRKPFRTLLPAVTHVNGSARVQTVAAEESPAFHALLKAVGRLSGREMVVNTSFNVKGQPIVNTPREAIETYLSTGIDTLVLEDYLIRRRPVTQ